jgi:hypothetical protein
MTENTMAESHSTGSHFYSSSNAGICRSGATFIFLGLLIKKMKYIACTWTHHDNNLTTIGSETILFKDSVFPRNNATPSTLRLGRRTDNKITKNNKYKRTNNDQQNIKT